MSRIMQVGASDDVFDKAGRAVAEAIELGQLPQGWRFGSETHQRLLAQPDRLDAVPPRSFFGLPWEVAFDAPADLLELDAF